MNIVDIVICKKCPVSSNSIAVTIIDKTVCLIDRNRIHRTREGYATYCRRDGCQSSRLSGESINSIQAGVEAYNERTIAVVDNNIQQFIKIGTYVFRPAGFGDDIAIFVFQIPVAALRGVTRSIV